MDLTYWNGEADAVHRRGLQRQLGRGTRSVAGAESLADAWGGYMDAGDWDRRSQHLTATWEHLELLGSVSELLPTASPVPTTLTEANNKCTPI